MKPILEVKNISKKFFIQSETLPYLNIRDRVYDLFKHKKRPSKENFWALQDISFNVSQGESIGIIGKNGAGKSTLLKILSKITPPTSGKIISRGRIASLLEVGTGFHPELSGRENIFLNGSILGMKKSEIKMKFDEIIDFSGIEKFIDTSLKHYSSGMQLRLAFAVAAFLEPEILVIDEVLAVGDAEFQKKCLKKMSEVSKSGRTVLFVSHNMDSVLRLCEKAILLSNGKIANYGSTDEVINSYLKLNSRYQSVKSWDNESGLPGNEIVQLLSVKAHTKEGEISAMFDITRPIGITMEYIIHEEGHLFTHGCNIYNEHGVNVFNSHDVVSEGRNIPRKKGKYAATMWIPENMLTEGDFSVGVAILNQAPEIIYLHELDVILFNIYDMITGSSARGQYVGAWTGIIRPLLNWDAKKID